MLYYSKMTYFLLFLISFLFSLFAVWLAEFLGMKFQFFDLPKEDPLKIHQKPISFLAGAAMFLIFSILFFCASYFQRFLNWKVGAILFSAFLIFFLGFFDDLKWKNRFVKPEIKLMFLILFSFFATIILVSAEIKIQFFPIWIFGFILTFFYIFGAINAVNFEDGMDGLVGGLAIISLSGFLILGTIFGNNLALFISLIVLGAVLGFLTFNFPPAKIFMGDSGAYFLGFILAVLAMIFSKPYNIPSILGPILIIGLPIFDTLQVILRRFFQKKSIFLGTRNHFYDILHFKKGFSIKKTLLTCYLLQTIFVISGLLLLFTF